MKIKILKSECYNRNFNYSYEKEPKESPEHYINKDIENFVIHNPFLTIHNIEIITDRTGIMVVIYYTETNRKF